MKEKNLTALMSSFLRCYHAKSTNNPVFDDYLSEKLLGEDYDIIKANLIGGIPFFMPKFDGNKEIGLSIIVNKILAPSVLIRSAFTERILIELYNKKLVFQYLMLASGYDTFSYRNPISIPTFELDKKDVIIDKMERMHKTGLSPINSTLLDCDLRDNRWKEKLLSNGFNNTIPTYVSLLGISYYLTKEEFIILLNNIRNVVGKNSYIVFDYPKAHENKTIQSVLADGANEQMHSGYTSDDITEILELCNIDVVNQPDENYINTILLKVTNKQNLNQNISNDLKVGYFLGLFAE